MHGGCYDLFGHEGIHSLTDLKGKSVGVIAVSSGQYVFMSIMAAYVGLDPVKDVNWVTSPDVNPMELFAAGKVDVFLGFPPELQEVRARHIGHTIVNTVVDRPWSQYFCCMIEKYPAATTRVLRALLKATDLCASETERARTARMLVDQGFTERYDYALETLNEIPYDKWREYDPEASIRFYALRLHELGMIKSSSNKIIADGTDWRFLDELKRELTRPPYLRTTRRRSARTSPARFLTGAPAVIGDVTRRYGVFVAKQADGLVDHVPHVAHRPARSRT